MSKYYVDEDGVYLGGFEGAEPPEGAVEVPSAPSDARQIWDGGAWGAVPVDLATYAADKRWQVETGGITVGSAVIRTDVQSQNRVAGAALLAISDPDLETIDWEAQPGEWVSVSATEMTAIGIAVGRHVQACFTALKAVQAAITAGTITTTAQIDTADWPAH